MIRARPFAWLPYRDSWDCRLYKIPCITWPISFATAEPLWPGDGSVEPDNPVGVEFAQHGAFSGVNRAITGEAALAGRSGSMRVLDIAPDTACTASAWFSPGLTAALLLPAAATLIPGIFPGWVLDFAGRSSNLLR